MPRLGSLLLGNNAITRIASGLEASLPGLHTLVLSNNRLASLVELDAMASVASLRRLALLGNPVARRPQYRLYAIFRLPQVTELDFCRVTRKDKVAAVKWASSGAGRAFLREVDAQRAATHPEITSLPSLLGRQAVAAAGGAGAGALPSGASAAADGALGAVAAGPAGFTAAEAEAIKAALAAADSAEAFAEMERHLRAGRLPPSAAALLAAGTDDAAAGGAATASAAAAVVGDAPAPLGFAPAPPASGSGGRGGGGGGDDAVGE